MPAPLRLLFAGSPAAAVPSLTALLASHHEVAAVVTREDSPQGRKRILTPTPVAEAADRAGVPVVKADRLAPVAERLAEFGADLGVIVAYGGLIREPLLIAPRLGWINLHFSLLPRWRGAAPVQRAIMAGDTTTGTSVFQLVEELDAGPVYDVEPSPIGAHQTAGQLLDRLAVSGAAQLVRVVDDLAAGRARALPQSGTPTLAPKLGLEDGRIDWTSPAAELDALIRGATPEPGAHTTLSGERFKILEASISPDAVPLAPGRLAVHHGEILVGTGDAPLALGVVQPAGKRAMAAADWWRGRPAGASEELGA